MQPFPTSKLLYISLAWLLASLMPVPCLAENQVTAFDKNVHHFLRTYCFRCHGALQQKGERAFHEIAGRDGNKLQIDLADTDTMQTLEEILDQLNLGQMPPDEKGIPQPTDEEIKTTVRWLTDTLKSADSGHAPAQTVLRRLNRREYRNTVEDLLGLENLTVDPTRLFPVDEEREGFTNIGDALNLSEAHLDQYLRAADEYLRMALCFSEPQPTETIRPPFRTWGYPEREATTPWMYRLQTEDKYLDIGAGQKDLARHVQLPTYPQAFVWQGGIKHPGYYRITIRAEAIRRLTHPYDPQMIPADLTPPMQLGLYLAQSREGLQPGGVKARTRLGLWDLQDHKADTYTATVWLAAGAIPFLNWDNGPGPSDYWMRDILKKYHDDIEFRGKQGSHAWHIVGKNAVPGRLVSDVWQGPLLRIHDFSFTGPLPRTYSSLAQRLFFDGSHDATSIDERTVLRRFVARAFRRPITSADVEPYVAIAKQAREKLDRTHAESLLLAMKAVLVSPDFLYLREDGDDQKRLTEYELANRLSYFLWSSLPDRQLVQHAKSKQLLETTTLAAETKRMLTHPNSDALIMGLCDSWLRFDKLGTMPPDSSKFPEYYRNGLEPAMREETQRFVTHVVRHNRPLRELLDAQYSYLNQDLARLYGIPNVVGSHFRRVALPKESHRGGLLGQGSILTLTANGVDTSPIVRGIWILENILGTPPPPPPPDVEPLEPDVRGTTTLKQRLARHRTVTACAECHNRIDPLGFPLEHYDPIGGYRTHYLKVRRWNRATQQVFKRAGNPIDGVGALSSGRTFSNLAELRRYLLSREEQFVRTLVHKVLTYATGREITFRDHEEIEHIVQQLLEDKKAGMGDLIVAVVTSDAFRQR